MLKTMFKATVTTLRRVIFEGEVESAFLSGVLGEFEILEFHKPLVSLLKEGIILFDKDTALAISKGVAQFRDNELVAFVEQ
ncbi:MAG: hypothetical protein V1882_12830 [Candidatus Omnitrophota bacterium]